MLTTVFLILIVSGIVGGWVVNSMFRDAAE
jgi:hypothetical protein